MSDCKHLNSFETMTFDGRAVHSCFCRTCREQLPLGPATESPQTAVERRAAEIVADEGPTMSNSEVEGWWSATIEQDCYPGGDVVTPGYEAAWLAFHIVHHDALHIAHEGGGR